jgi:hypothetical protein
MITRHVKLLILSIKQLGFVTGFKYFQMYLRAMKDPSFVLEWANSCDQHARKLEFFNPDDPVAQAARHWARALRECNIKIKKYEEQIDAL